MKQVCLTASSPPEDSEVYNDPSFIFLQFFYSSTLGTTLGDTPLLVSSGEVGGVVSLSFQWGGWVWSPGGVSLFIQLGTISLQATARAMKLLDLIPPYDTHKIGIIYVDKDQVNIIMCIVPSPSPSLPVFCPHLPSSFPSSLLPFSPSIPPSCLSQDTRT